MCEAAHHRVQTDDGAEMADERRQTTQSIAWFWDLHQRGLLELDPPYQRRSVWPNSYKSYFIDTILLNYPAPALFLFENITETGAANYSVVDGKQRLTTIFEFLDGIFSTSEVASASEYDGAYFVDLPGDVKRKFFSYQFSIEFLPTTDQGTLNNIFDRINRNVARLTPQELRHAQFSGTFAQAVDASSDFFESALPKDFPRIAPTSKRQMKDVEFVAQLLLLVERGVETHSQADLDLAYKDRDDDWPERSVVTAEFHKVTQTLNEWAEPILASKARRLRNQADFYSLFAVVLNKSRDGSLPDSATASSRLEAFFDLVESETSRQVNDDAKRYYEAARSASNDAGQRKERVRILSKVLSGED